MKKKYIIGLGCSWTQGEGGYPEEIWQSHNGRVQIRSGDDYYLRHIEHENSWVNVLCRDYFTNCKSINLGVRGIGNLAAANQLYFCDRVDWDNSTGLIIFMLSGTERLSVFGANIFSNGQDDYYSDNVYKHYKYNTAWPFPNKDNQFADAYAKELYSETFCALHSATAILNAQNFAKAHGFEFILANAFNQRELQNPSLQTWFNTFAPGVCDKIKWENYIHNYVDYQAFVQFLVRMDKLIPEKDWGGYFEVYYKRSWPSKYLTNCLGAHPTLNGYKLIASEISEWIKDNVDPTYY